MEAMSELRDFVEEPIVNAMQIYVDYVKDGSMSKENAKLLIEEYGALICFLDTSIEDPQSREMIAAYRRNMIDLAKNTIDAIGEKLEQKNEVSGE